MKREYPRQRFELSERFLMTVFDCFVMVVRTRIVRPPQSSSAIKASQVTLECGVERDMSVAVTWLWFVGDNEISFSSEPRMSMSLSDGSLTIKSVRNTDIGRYMCRVISIAGNDSAVADLDFIGTIILHLFSFVF